MARDYPVYFCLLYPIGYCSFILFIYLGFDVKIVDFVFEISMGFAENVLMMDLTSIWIYTREGTLYVESGLRFGFPMF